MPLLGSYGGSSEYAYRGTIDDFPNDFSFTNQTNAIPGNLLTSNQVTITGINNRALVRVSAGASVSVNGGSYVIPTEASPVFIRNNQTLSVRIPSTSGQLSDFNKSYSANVSVGRKTALWEVKTKIVDVDPTPFTFTNQTNREIGVGYTSNEITISGLESGFSFPASITSGDGQIILNGGSGVPSVNVVNGDRIYLRLISPFEYSNYPTGSGTKTNTTSVQVGSYSTSWSVSSRDVDIFINPFDFNDVNNALSSSVYTAQSVNPSGVVTTITGADQGIPLVTAVTGCELQVEQPAAGGGFSIRRPYSTANTVVFNGDRLTARITTSGNFSETKVGIVTVSNFTGRFIVTTRSRPIDTIPDTFTFTDITANRGATVESNEITLVGMTTFTDEGVASLTTGTNGGNAQFQVTRGTQVVRNYTGIGTYPVRNGDKIKLKITADLEQNITRTATFRVDGIDTSIVITGQTGFKDDIWSVTAATRNCDITAFTLPTVNNANRSTVQTTTFTVGGFQSDCGMVVSTNVGSLSVQGSSLTNNIPVSPGTVVTLRVTSSASFGASTVATVTVSNTPTGIIPNKTYSTTWTVNTTQDTTPASVTLTANPTSVAPGQPITLSWTSVNAAEVTASSGFTATSVTGSTQVSSTTIGTQTYSISVRGNPSASNFPNVVTSPVSVTVSEDTTPDSFSLSPSSFIDQDKSFEVSATSSTVSGLSQNTKVSASISGSASAFSVNNGSRVTQPQLVGNGDSIRVFMTTSGTENTSVTGTLNIGTQSSSFTATTKACDPISTTNTSQKFYANGTVTVNFKAAIVQPALASPTPPFLYTSKTGGGLFTKCKADLETAGGWSRAIGQTLTVPIPPGVTQLNVAAVGGGGGGLQSRGGGGGGYSRATVPFPGNGGTVTLIAAPISGQGASGGPSSVQVNGATVISAGGGTVAGPGGSGNVGGGGLGGTPLLGANGGVGGGSLGGGGNPGTPVTSNTPPSPAIVAGGSGGGITFFSSTTGALPVSFQNGSPATKLQPSLVVAANGPNNGGGGGGGGGGPSSSKTNGSSGSAVVAYAGQSITAPTWDELINTIVNTYNSNASRPPRDSEMDTWTSTFTSNATLTLSGLQTQIANSIGSQKATSVRNNCGGTF